MNRTGIAITLSAGMLLVAVGSLLSCGHEQRLTAITIHPASATFLGNDPKGQIVYTARGSYIHPPQDKDITTLVTWSTDIPQLVTVNGGVVSPQAGGVCGVADISASLVDHGFMVVGYATVTVNDPTNAICPGGGTEGALTVTLAGPIGGGTVASVPGGINCPSQSCAAVFSVGSVVGLIATPAANHSFTGWTGCTSFTGNNCSVTVPAGGVNVTATFN